MRAPAVMTTLASFKQTDTHYTYTMYNDEGNNADEDDQSDIEPDAEDDRKSPAKTGLSDGSPMSADSPPRAYGRDGSDTHEPSSESETEVEDPQMYSDLAFVAEKIKYKLDSKLNFWWTQYDNLSAKELKQYYVHADNRPQVLSTH